MEPSHLSLLQSGELKFLQEYIGKNSRHHAVSLGLISVKSVCCQVMMFSATPGGFPSGRKCEVWYVCVMCLCVQACGAAESIG